MVRNRLYISKYDRNINSTWYDYKTTLSRLIRRLEDFNSIWYDYKLARRQTPPSRSLFQFHMVRL